MQRCLGEWAKGSIFIFSKKSVLEIITLTDTAAKMYNALLNNCIRPKGEKILRKNQNGFQSNRSITSQIPNIRWIIEEYEQKDS